MIAVTLWTWSLFSRGAREGQPKHANGSFTSFASREVKNWLLGDILALDRILYGAGTNHLFLNEAYVPRTKRQNRFRGFTDLCSTRYRY